MLVPLLFRLVTSAVTPCFVSPSHLWPGMFPAEVVFLGPPGVAGFLLLFLFVRTAAHALLGIAAPLVEVSPPPLRSSNILVYILMFMLSEQIQNTIRVTNYWRAFSPPRKPPVGIGRHVSSTIATHKETPIKYELAPTTR